jgi:hypothetical protein
VRARDDADFPAFSTVTKRPEEALRLIFVLVDDPLPPPGFFAMLSPLTWER